MEKNEAQNWADDLNEKEKIAFLDLFKETLQLVNQVRDNFIVAYTIDYDAFKTIKEHKKLRKIVPVSRLAEDILKRKLEIDDSRVDYHQMFCGGSYAEWRKVFE